MSVTPMIGILVRLVGNTYGRGSGSVQGQDIGHRISSALFYYPVSTLHLHLHRHHPSIIDLSTIT